MSDRNDLNRKRQAQMAASPSSLESLLALACRAMREQAADADSDDYYGRLSSELLRQSLVVLIAVAIRDGLLTWLMHHDHEVVVAATASVHWKGEEHQTFARAETMTKDYLLTEIEQRVDWLMKEADGERLAEFGQLE